MTLRLNGDSSGFTEIKAPNAAGDNSITLPTSNGSANQLLQNGGTAGALQYTSAGGGLHYDSSGRLLVGTDSQSTIRINIVPRVQVEATTATQNGLMAFSNVNSGSGAFLVLGKSRGGVAGSSVSVNSGDSIGSMMFIAADGTNRDSQVATISASIDGTPGVNDTPGKLAFSTTADGSNAPTPRVEITNNGTLKLLSDCPGISFHNHGSGSGVISNLLNDYEVGSWSPVLQGSTGGSLTLLGRYTKVGNIVTVRVMRWASIPSGTLSGNLKITGLPFNSANNPQNQGSGVASFGPLHIRAAAAGIDEAPWALIGTTTIFLHRASKFGSTAVYSNQSETYEATKLTQNGSSSVIIDWLFTYYAE